MEGLRLRLLRLPSWVLLAVLVVLAFAPYIPAIGGGYVYDDRVAIKNNQAVQSDFSLSNIVQTGFWGGDEDKNSGSYRPLAVLTFAIDKRIGGGAPWVFHLTNILLHCLCVVVLFYVLRRRFGEIPGLLITGIFAVHALHTENVAGLVARADVMATTLGVLAWQAAYSRRWRWVLAAGPLFFLALMAKEIAVAFIGLIIVEQVLRLVEDDRPLLKRLMPIVAMALALGVYLLFRWNALGLLAAKVHSQSNPLVLTDSLAERIWTASALLTKTVELAIFPATLSADYSYAEIMPYPSVWDREVLTGLGLWLFVPLAALLYVRRVPKVTIGLALFFASYVPISNLFLIIPTIFAERLLYLPSLGLIIAAVSALVPFWTRVRARRYLVALFVLVMVGNAARSFVRSYDWRSPESLFRAATEASPNSARNWFNLGVAALHRGQPEEGLKHIERSIAIKYRQPRAHSYLGVALDQLDRPKEAHLAMYRAVRWRRTCRQCFGNLINLYIKYGHFKPARKELRWFKRVNPALAKKLLDQVERAEAAAIREGLIQPNPLK